MADNHDSEGTIVIGTGVSFKGEVTVPGRATVSGKFEGVLKAAELIVGPSGHVNGQVSVETAEIHGKVEDNLTVQSKLTVRSSGTVAGTVTYSKIMVEEGGILAGTFNMISPKAVEKAPEARVVHLQKAE